MAFISGQDSNIFLVIYSLYLRRRIHTYAMLVSMLMEHNATVPEIQQQTPYDYDIKYIKYVSILIMCHGFV